jgi:hypothetical protein
MGLHTCQVPTWHAVSRTRIELIELRGPNSERRKETDDVLACTRQGLDSRAWPGSRRSARLVRAQEWYFAWRCPYRVHKMSNGEDHDISHASERDIIMPIFHYVITEPTILGVSCSLQRCATCRAIFRRRDSVSVFQRTYHHMQIYPMKSRFRCLDVPSPLPHKLPFNQAILTNPQVPPLLLSSGMT